MKVNHFIQAFSYGIFFLIFFIASCGADSQFGNQVIGVKELVDNKEKYHGKEVFVSGYISYVFEGCVIWPENPEKDISSFKYEVWYRSQECMTNTNAQSGYAVIQGVFDMNDTGHLWSYKASIKNAKVHRQDPRRLIP